MYNKAMEQETLKKKRHISEEEVKEEFDREQGEVDNPTPKGKPDPFKIEREYTGDLSGDPDDTTPEEVDQEIERRVDERPIVK